MPLALLDRDSGVCIEIKATDSESTQLKQQSLANAAVDAGADDSITDHPTDIHAALAQRGVSVRQ